MPLLVYSNSDFVAQTAARASAVNARYNDIKTLLNTTGLDDTNIQNAGITRATKLKTGTANHVLINAGDGTMSSEAQLASSRGGTGLNIDPTTGQPGDVLQVNSTSTALVMSPPTGVPASLRIFQYYNFT